MAKDPKDRRRKEERPALTRGQWIFAVAAVLLLVGSAIGRAKLSDGSEERAGAEAVPGMAAGLTAGDERRVSEEVEEGGIEALLPYVTEASFFALMGFAVGYATRKVVKVILILLALFFVGIQLLSRGGLADVEWSGVLGALNDLVFNLKENQTVTEVLTNRVPSTGAFLLGLVLGFKRG